jgi:hypothetical protein
MNDKIKERKGDLQKLIAINANEVVMTVDLALGLIGTYMLRKASARIKDWKEMETFLSFLLHECFKGKKKKIVTEGSFADCVLYIQNFLSELTFENKKRKLLSLDLKVITEIDDNGYLSFNDITFNTYARQPMIGGVPAHNYILTDVAKDCIEDNIEENYNFADDTVDAEEDSGEDNIISETEAVTNNDNPNEQEMTTPDDPVLLEADYGTRQQNICTDNTPFIQLYDELIAANPENRKNDRFVWQWFLTLDEYEAIKTCFTTNLIPTQSKWKPQTVRLLALYIGEFYKREYENNVTPFAQNTPNYSKICEKLNIEPYKKDNKAHLHTLYVNGGLPVHYISSKLDNTQSNLFIEGLSKLLNAEDEIDFSEGEEALGKVCNTALRESYQRGTGHSIFEYIQAIMAGDETWNNSDKSLKDFQDFIDKIKEANKKAAERKKFKLFYSLWTYFKGSNLEEFSLQPQIRFNPEEDGDRHYAISLQRLANWGITNPPSQFSLRLGNNEMKFTKCINGDYISWNMADRIDLNRLDRNLTIEDLLHSNLSIVFDRLNGESFPIKNAFNLPFKNGYLQFYTDDDPSMASWNSFKGAHSFLWSGLMYDKNRYHLLSPITVTNINKELGWVTFSDCVAFEDRKNGKIHSFFNSKGRIYAKPSEDSLHKNIIESPCLLPYCLLDGMAECTIGEKRSYAYIVKSSKLKFDVFRVANDEKVEMGQLVEYKNAQEYSDSSSSWKEYKSENLEKGLYVFRVYKARYSTEVICLVLPDDARIEFYNTSTPYLIKFIGFPNVTVSSKRVSSSEKDNETKFKIQNNNVDSYDFTIGDKYGSVSLQTYHPKPQTHVYLYGQEITNKPIIMAYAEEIEIISKQTSSKSRLSDNTQAYKRLFDALSVKGFKDTKKAKKIESETEKVKKIKKEKTDSEKERAKIQAAQDARTLLIQGFKLGDCNLKVRVYTQEFQQDRCDDSCKLMLLNLENNQIKELGVPYHNFKVSNDSLLFQSLKEDGFNDVYYAPCFISKQEGTSLASEKRAEKRLERLASYVEGNSPKYVSNYAYQQFEIACEHKIYFAVFDSLLCLCWNSTNCTYLDRNNKKFKDNLYAFLKGYVSYTANFNREPNVAGLKRLAREFLFDWKIIKNDIESSDSQQLHSQQLKELYQEIINN